MHSFALHVVEEDVIQSLEAHRPELHRLDHTVSRGENIVVTEYEQRTHRWIVDKPDLGGKYEHAGSFSAHQGAGDVEALFGKQRRKVVTGNAPRDHWEFAPDSFGITIAQFAHAPINFCLPSTFIKNALKFTV